MRLSTFVTAAALALSALAAHAAEAAYKIGDTIPGSLTVTDHMGKSHTFESLRGKPVLLEWTNYACPFVRKHYNSGNMQKLQQTYTEKGVTWLSVISSAEGKQGYLSAADAPGAVAKQGFKGTAVVLDTKGELGKAFGAETTPAIAVLDAAGKLAYFGAIDSIPSFSQEDIAKADNYAAQALDAVLAGKAVATPTTRSYGCSVKY